MPTHIENANQHIIAKFGILRAINTRLAEFCTQYTESAREDTMYIARADSTRAKLAIIADKITELEKVYMLASINILIKYYQCPSDDSITSDYYQVIRTNNIISKIDDIIVSLRACFAGLTNEAYLAPDSIQTLITYESAGIINMFQNIDNYDINMQSASISNKRCICGGTLISSCDSAEARCIECCLIIHYDADYVMNNHISYTPKKVNTSNDKYKRHLHLWIDRIQAVDGKRFDPEVLAKIRGVFDKIRISPKGITCSLMRSTLKELGLTSLNDYVPSLVKEFGGQCPPLLQSDEREQLEKRFDRVIELYAIVNPNAANYIYYPYFIYKILEIMFQNNPEKLEILKFIHFQSNSTIIKNDKYYRDICKLAKPGDGLIYKPTIRTHNY